MSILVKPSLTLLLASALIVGCGTSIAPKKSTYVAPQLNSNLIAKWQGPCVAADDGKTSTLSIIQLNLGRSGLSVDSLYGNGTCAGTAASKNSTSLTYDVMSVNGKVSTLVLRNTEETHPPSGSPWPSDFVFFLEVTENSADAMSVRFQGGSYKNADAVTKNYTADEVNAISPQVFQRVDTFTSS